MSKKKMKVANDDIYTLYCNLEYFIDLLLNRIR